MAKAKKAPAKKEAPKAPAEPKYVLGEKEYRPKTEKNKQSWAIVQKTVPATLRELQKALVYELEGSEVKHADFIGYMVRGEHLALKK